MIEISLTAIVKNYHKLQALLQNGTICGASVKGNAYGLGVRQVVPTLYQSGCRDFFVSWLNEGIELSKVLATLEQKRQTRNNAIPSPASIYTLHGVNNRAEVTSTLQHKITPIINNNQQLQLWLKHGGENNPIALHIDTGLNRLGWRLESMSKLPMNLNYGLVMSHLACADEPNHNLNAIQLQRFQNIRTYFLDNYKSEKMPQFSLANSSGIFLGKEYHFDLVRPGYALYGGHTIDKSIITTNIPSTGMRQMHPVIKITSRIIQKSIIGPNEYIGYGATYATNDTKIKTLVIEGGYCDGYTRFGAEGAVIWAEGHFLPVVGRVSMDLTVIDATSLPNEIYDTIENVELLNEYITIDDVRKMNNNVIGYEFIARLGSRYQRSYT